MIKEVLKNVLELKSAKIKYSVGTSTQNFNYMDLTFLCHGHGIVSLSTCYSSLPGRKKTVSFSERKQSDSEMSTDTDGRTPDTDVTDSVSDNEEEEKSGSARKIARARKHWKIGIGKVGVTDHESIDR